MKKAQGEQTLPLGLNPKASLGTEQVGIDTKLQSNGI